MSQHISGILYAQMILLRVGPGGSAAAHSAVRWWGSVASALPRADVSHWWDRQMDNLIFTIDTIICTVSPLNPQKEMRYEGHEGSWKCVFHLGLFGSLRVFENLRSCPLTSPCSWFGSLAQVSVLFQVFHHETCVVSDFPYLGAPFTGSGTQGDQLFEKSSGAKWKAKMKIEEDLW